MTRLAMLVLILLGSLAGGAEAMDGEATGRFSLELVGFIVTAFLFYVAFSGVILALFSGKWRHKRPVVEHPDVTEMASAAAGSGEQSPEALKAAAAMKPRSGAQDPAVPDPGRSWGGRARSEPDGLRRLLVAGSRPHAARGVRTPVDLPWLTRRAAGYARWSWPWAAGCCRRRPADRAVDMTARPLPARRDPTHPDPVPGRGCALRILVVDDQPQLAELIQAILTDGDHTVEAVSGGRAALDQLAATSYDLVLCDLQMPDVDGVVDVYRAIEQLVPPRPAVLLMTGYTEGSAYAEFLQATRAAVLSKPVGIDELRARVSRLLNP